MTESVGKSYPPTPFVLIFFLATAAAFRAGLLTAPGEFDEFYHLLAGKGILDFGVPRILDGEYWRGAIFTRLIAELFRLTGSDALPMARAVSMVAGTLVPALVFLWAERNAGFAVAFLAAAFAVVWPQGIIESQLARFYSLHTLSFLSGAAAFYLLLMDGRPKLILALVTVLSWYLAVRLQISSLIGIGGACLGGALVLWSRSRWSFWQGIAFMSVIAASALLALVLLGGTDAPAKAWGFYRWTPGHAAPLRDYYGFYFQQFETDYGVLWLAGLILVPLGLSVNAPLAIFCAAVFGVSFVVHSFGGMKAMRYISYATPFLFVAGSLGLRGTYILLVDRLSPKVSVGIVSIAGLAIISATAFVPRSLELAAGRGIPSRGDWSHGLDVVGDWLSLPFVATTRELHHIAYLGNYDILFSASRRSELDPPHNYSVDVRTGRPVVGDVEEMARVMLCVPEGLLVTTPNWWTTQGWGDRILRELAGEAPALTTREDGALLAIRWRHKSVPPQNCELTRNRIVGRLAPT